MSYNQFSGAGVSWDSNLQNTQNGWKGNNDNIGGGITPMNNPNWSQGTQIQCTITENRPEDLKGLPTIEELLKVVLQDKEAFKAALNEYNKGGFTTLEDAFVRVIGNTMATKLFNLIDKNHLKSYAESLANGTEFKLDNSEMVKLVYNSLSTEDRETYDILDVFIEWVYKSSGSSKIDIKQYKIKNKKNFVRAFAKFLITTKGKALSEKYNPERYKLDKAWEIYSKI